mgnify:CR=1 FL=1
MAALPVIAAGLGLVNTFSGIFESFQGAETTRIAEKAIPGIVADIEGLKPKAILPPELPTRGIDVAKDLSQQRYATGVSALQSGGPEAVLGGLTGLEQQHSKQDLAMAAQLEKMEYARNLDLSKQEQAIENQRISALRNLNFMRLQGAQTAALGGYERGQEGKKQIFEGIGLGAETFLQYSPLYGGKDDATI